MTPFEPNQAATGFLKPVGSVVHEEKVISERLRRYFSEFAVIYIQQEVRHTGKPLGTVVEEVLRDRVSVTQLTPALMRDPVMLSQERMIFTVR